MLKDIKLLVANLIHSPEDTDLFNEIRTKLASEEISTEERTTFLKKSHMKAARAHKIDLAYEFLKLAVEHDPENKELVELTAEFAENDLWNGQESIDLYKRLTSLDPDNDNWTEKLEDLELEASAWEKLLDKFVTEAEEATEPELSSHMFFRAAEVAAKYSSDDDKVEELLLFALENDENNLDVAKHLAMIYRKNGNHNDLAELLHKTSTLLKDADLIIATMLEISTLFIEHLGRAEEAIDFINKILEINPREEKAKTLLVDAYTSLNRMEDLIAFYEDEIKNSRNPDDGIYLQLGMLWWKKVGDLEAAEPYFQKLRKSEPASPLLLTFYNDYYKANNDYMRHVSLLQQAMRAVKGDQERTMEIARMIADISLENNPEKAIDVWKRILKKDKDNKEARAELKKLYEHTEKWPNLIDLYKEEEASLPEDATQDRIDTLFTMADLIEEKMGVDAMVVNVYQSILKLDPENELAQDAMAEKYESMGRWKDVITIYQQRADATEDIAIKKKNLKSVANLWMERLSNPNKAAEPLEQILEIDPRDREVIGLLKEIYETRRNWKGLYDLRLKELDLVPEDEKMAHIIDLAQFAQQPLGNIKLSIAAWNMVLEYDEYDLDALDALIFCYEREKRYPALVEILRRKISMSTDDEALPLLEKVGSLLTDKMNAMGPLSVEIWQRVHELKPGHPKAMKILKDLYAENKNWDELEHLFAERDNWLGYIETLSHAADASTEDEEKIALNFKVAEAYSDKLGKPERAIKPFEKILKVDPQNAKAAANLLPLYEGAKKFKLAAAMYEILFHNSDSTTEKLDWLDKLIQVNEEELGKADACFKWCAEAYALEPTDPSIIEKLERFAGESKNWEALADVYNGTLDALEGEEKFDVCGRLARIYVDELTELEKGAEIWSKVLEIKPNSEKALRGLAYILEIEEKWEDLNGILMRQIEGVDDPAEGLWAREKLASITENQLQNKEEAIKLYKEILEIDAAYLPALNALDALYESAEQWEELASILDSKMDLEDDEEKRASLNFRMGHLYQSNIEDLEKALDHFTAVLEHDPGRAGAIALVREIMNKDGGEEHGVRSAKLLLGYYEQEERWEDYTTALEIIARFEPDHEVQVEYYRELLGITTTKVGDMGKGFDLSLALFKLEPEDEENRKKLRALAKLDDRLNALKASYVELIEGDNEDLKLVLAWEVALIEEEDLENLTEAEKYYKIVLQEDALHEGAFDALERIYAGTERWEETRALYEQKINAITDPEPQKAMLLKLSVLNEDRLADVDAAIESYRAIRTLDPGSGDAFEPLIRLYELSDKWSDLADLYAEELEFRSNDAERVDLIYKRCDLFLHKLDQPMEAVELIQDILITDQSHDPTRNMLVEMLDLETTRQSAAETLESIYEKESNFEELIKMLEIKLEAAEDDIEAVELLSKEGRILTIQMAEPELAFQAWRRAIARDPSNLEVRTAIEQLAMAINSYGDLVTVWTEAIKAAGEEDSLVLLYLEKIAVIYEKQLGEPEQAIVWYRKLLDKAEDDNELQAKAAAALINLYSSVGEWIEIIELHKKQLDWTDWDEERKNIYRKIANLQEDMLDAPDEAAQTYNKLLEEFPEDDEAIERLESIYSRIEKWAELVDVLAKKVELSQDPEMRVSCLSRIAILREESLEDVEGAAEAWADILNEDPNNDEALRYLARLNEALGRWAEVFEFVERELALTTDPSEQRSLHYRLGYILQVHLEEPERAINFYRTVIEEDMEHEKAKVALEAMLQGEELLALQAAEILETIYEMEDDWEKLTGLYVLKAGYSMDPHEKVGLFLKIARIKEGDLAEPVAAFGFYGQALKEAGSEPELPEILAHLQRLASLEGKWEGLVELYKSVADDIMDPRIQEQVYLTIADVARDELHDLTTSQKYYENVLEQSPESGHALDALERVYEQTENWEKLLGIYLKRADMSLDDNDARFKALVSAATICREKLERPEDAIEHYNDILQFKPEESSIFRALEEILFDQEAWEPLIELYEHRIRYTEDLSEAVEIRFNMGEIFADFLEETDRALESFCAALGGDPTSDETVQRLEKFLDKEEYAATACEVLVPIYASRQAWDNLIKVFSLQRDLLDMPEERAPLTKRIAELYETVKEDLDQAFVWYGRLLLEMPQDKSIRDRLINLAELLKQWETIAGVFAQIIEEAYGPDEHIIEITERLARIYAKQLSKVDEALKCYKDILENERKRPGIFTELELLLLEHERWDDLLEVYREAAEAVFDPQEKNPYLFKITSVLEERLEKLEDAVEVYKEILEGSPENAEAINALTKLYTKLGKWEDLVEHLILQVERQTDPEEMQNINLKLAELYNEKLDDPSSAVDRIEEILTIDPLNEKCIDYLEKLLRREDVKLRVAAILQPIYTNLQYWDQLIHVYEVQISLIDDEYQKIQFLKECTNLYDTMNSDLPKAFASMAKAWQLDSTDRSNLEELYNLALRQGNWAELISVLEEGIKDTYDDELKVEVLMRIALIQSETLEEPESAVASYNRVLAVQDDKLEALTKLAALLLELEKWTELAETLDRKSELLSDPDETVATLRQLARLRQELLEQNEKAIETWQRLLTFAMADVEALKALEVLFEKSEQYDELAEILKSIIELGNEDRIPTAFKLATIQAEQLEDTYEAINALKVIIDEAPENVKALEKLASLYRKEENWHDLNLTIDRMVALEPDDAKRNGLIFETGQVLQVEIGDVEAALEKYRFILDFDNTHADARGALEKLLQEEEHRSAVAGILEPIYISQGADESLITMYKLVLEEATDPEKRANTLRSIAVLFEKLENLADAFIYWGRLFKEKAADQEVEQQLHRIASVENNWKDLVDIYDEVIEEVYEQGLKKQLLMTEMRIYEISLEDLEGAVRTLEKAAESLPDDMEVLAEYDRLLLATSKFEKLAEVLELEANASFEPADKAEFLYRLGLLRKETFSDAEGAIDAWRDTLQTVDNHEATIAALEAMMEEGGSLLAEVLDVLQPVYEMLSLPRKTVVLLGHRVTLLEDASERARVYEKAARITSDLGEIDKSLEYWGLATKEAPDDPAYLDQFIAVADIADQQHLVIALAKELVESGKLDEMVLTSVCLKAAPVALRKGDPQAAEFFYLAILKIEEENGQALKALEELYRVGDDVTKLVNILKKRAELEYDPQAKRKLLVEIAKLYEIQLENVDGAVAAYKELLESDETDNECQVELMRLYNQLSKWTELIEILQIRITYMQSPEEAQGLRRSIAEIYQTKLKNADEAEEAWREAYDMDPNDELSFKALRAIYMMNEDWDAVKDMFYAKLGQAAIDSEKIPILEAMAKLSMENMNEPEEAAEFYRQILEIDPGHDKAYKRTETIFMNNEQYYDLIEVLKKRVEHFNSLGDGDKAVFHLDQMARIWEEKLETPSEAIKILEQILATSPGNVTALTGMARLYENMQDWEHCQQYLEKAALLEPQGREGAELAFRRGNVAMKLNDEEVAQQRWEEALRLYAMHDEAFVRLSELVKAKGDNQTLLRLYQMKLPMVEDPEEKLPMLLSMSDLFVELGASEAAFPYLEEAVQIDPENISVKRKLGDIYFAAGNNDKAMEIYTSLADLLEGNRKMKKDLAVIYQRMSGIKENTGDDAEAIELCSKAQRLDPTNVTNIIALANLHIKVGELDKGQKLYRALLFQKLDGEITKAEIFLEVAKIDLQLGNANKALASAKRGLSEDPSNEAIKAFIEQLS